MIPSDPISVHWLWDPRPGDGSSRLTKTWARTPLVITTSASPVRRWCGSPLKSRMLAKTVSTSESVNQRSASNMWTPMSSHAPPSPSLCAQPWSSVR